MPSQAREHFTLTPLCQPPTLWGHCVKRSLTVTLEHRTNYSLACLMWLWPRADATALWVPSDPGTGRLNNVNMSTTTVYGSPHPRVRVLVADDHEVMRLGIRNLLEVRPGWSVCAEASNGKEAVEKTLQFHPDVIIMDITMPVMNGLEAASQITKRQPQIPVILFSLHISDDLYRHFKTDGIRGAVAKGDAARDLVLAVETVLGGKTFFPGRKPA